MSGYKLKHQKKSSVALRLREEKTHASQETEPANHIVEGALEGVDEGVDEGAVETAVLRMLSTNHHRQR